MFLHHLFCSTLLSRRPPLLRSIPPPLSLSFALLLFSSPCVSPQQVSYLRSKLVLSSFENDLELAHITGFPSSVEDMLDTYKVDDENISDWYARMNIILEEAMARGAAEDWSPIIARQFRVSHLAPLLQEVVDQCRQGGAPGVVGDPVVVIPAHFGPKKGNASSGVLRAVAKFRALSSKTSSPSTNVTSPLAASPAESLPVVDDGPPPPPPPHPMDGRDAPPEGKEPDGGTSEGFKRKFVPGLPAMEIEYDDMYMTRAMLPAAAAAISRAGGAVDEEKSDWCDVYGAKKYIRYPEGHAQRRGSWDVRWKGAQFPYPAPAGRRLPPSYMHVCVFGGDAALHRVLCNYVVTRQVEARDFTDEQELQERMLNIRIFMIPTAHGLSECSGGQLSEVASFIARHDVWYRRQVYSQFTGWSPSAAPVLVLPQLRQETSCVGRDRRQSASGSLRNRAERGSSGGGQGGGGPPLSYLIKLLHDYVKSARRELQLQVYDCECWEPLGAPGGEAKGAGGAGDAPDVTIPFCARAELGLKASARRMLAMNNMTMQEAYAKVGKNASTLKNAMEIMLYALADKNEMLDTGDIKVHTTRRVVSADPEDDGDFVEISEQVEDAFGVLTFRNVPPTHGRQASSSLSPSSEELEIYSIRQAGDFADQVRAACRRRSTKDEELRREVWETVGMLQLVIWKGCLLFVVGVAVTSSHLSYPLTRRHCCTVICVCVCVCQVVQGEEAQGAQVESSGAAGTAE